MNDGTFTNKIINIPFMVGRQGLEFESGRQL
jgi:hypothetical protein